MSSIGLLRSSPHRRARGVTLVEMIAAIVILGVALTLIARTVAQGVAVAPEVVLEARAVALAQSYLDEILARRFDESSPANGIPPYTGACNVVREEAARADYDDVDDYHGLVEGYDPDDAMAPALHDAQGNVRGGYERFGVAIVVRCLDAGEGETDFGLPSRDIKLISVTVTYPSRLSGWTFSAYKVNF